MTQGFLHVFMLAGLLTATRVFAFDLSVYAGQQTVLSNNLFSSESGTGNEVGGRVHVSPGSQSFFSLGVDYSTSKYTLVSKGSDDPNLGFDGISASGSGQFSGESYGPHFTVSVPLWGVSLYLGFGYNFSTYIYKMLKETRQSGADMTPIETELRASVMLQSTGLKSGIGIRTNGEYAIMIEIADAFQTLDITEIHAIAANRIGGELQPRDGSEESLEAVFQGLIGSKLIFSTRSVTVGMVWVL